jgi:phosphatidylinositol alpha 1,6-mannosyltransferase
MRKIEQGLLASGNHVAILTTASGDMTNTHMDGEHPNRRVIFVDNSIPVPFTVDKDNPAVSYHLGFNLSTKTKEYIADFDPTIVHVTAPDICCLYVIQYARDQELPLMGTYHSNIQDYMLHYPGLGFFRVMLGALFRHHYNFLQHVYAPTPFMRQYLIDTWQYDTATKMKIWGRGIDLERFSPSRRSREFRQKLGVADDVPILLWVSRAVNEKRPDIFAKVVRRLHAQKVKFHAVVVGDGPVIKLLTSLPNTTYLGWLSGDELPIAYASSEVFLFPSAVETFGNVTLEAVASGLPLVVEGGCSGHLVKEGVNGFAIEKANFNEYFEATRRLLTDASLQKKMSNGSIEFSQEFEKGKVVEKMVENYALVTKEFYRDYGGLHENRDNDKAYDFRLGSNPLPWTLWSYLIVILRLFQLCWYSAAFLYSAFMYVFGGFFSQSEHSGAGENTIPPVSPSNPQAAGQEVSDDEQSRQDELAKRSTESFTSAAKQWLLSCTFADTLTHCFVEVASFQCRTECSIRKYFRKKAHMIRHRKKSDPLVLPKSVRRSPKGGENI